jgi:hypothetical protein
VVLGASTLGAKFYPHFGLKNIGRFLTYSYSKTWRYIFCLSNSLCQNGKIRAEFGYIWFYYLFYGSW